MKGIDKVRKPVEKRHVVINVGLFLSSRLTFLYKCKNKTFSIKYLDKRPTPEPTPNPAVQTKAKTKISKQKIPPIKINENFENKIRHDDENINKELFEKNSGYQNSSIFSKKSS